LFNSRLKFFQGKLRSKWYGPFIVKNIRPYGAIELEYPRTNQRWIVNGQRLRIYHGEDFERSVIFIEFKD